MQTRIVQRTDRANCRHVIECEDRGERAAFRQQLCSRNVTNFGRWRLAFKLRYQFRFHRNSQPSRHSLDRIPPDVGIRTETLSFDKRNLAMTYVEQVCECQFGGAVVVQLDIRHAFTSVMS